MILSAMSLMAADSKPIYVTTFDDEAGENSSHCSLREAIIAAQKNTSFGGCSAGRTGLGQTDVIELQAGTYLLTRGELSPESSVRILGKSRNNYEAKSAFTDAYPAYEEIKTVIASKNADSRLFNTAATRADVQLQDIALKNGYAKDYGGAVYAGANFSIKRGAVADSKAGKAGGAIYAVALDANKEINISLGRTIVEICLDVLLQICHKRSISFRSYNGQFVHTMNFIRQSFCIHADTILVNTKSQTTTNFLSLLTYTIRLAK